MSIAQFEVHRNRLRALAYRMLGSRSEADDIVQEAWLRWQAVDSTTVQDPQAYLCRTTTRLCLDHVKSARRQREQYVGVWLPEPLVDGAMEGYQFTTPEETLSLRQQLSLGFLLALQHLSAQERATFLLHDVFDLGFDEIAATLERSSATCRQLARRARQRLSAKGFDAGNSPSIAAFPPPTAPPKTHALLAAFAQALASGDVAVLAGLLAEDVRLYSDGGGMVSAVPVPLDGAMPVAKALTGFAKSWASRSGAQGLQAACVNGHPGALLWRPDGTLEQVCALELDTEGRVRGLYLQRNPKKLHGVRGALKDSAHARTEAAFSESAPSVSASGPAPRPRMAG
ncbi:MAG: RNA polymerase sigma factor SigJ [Burkholderiaceae bacterium]